MFPDQVIQSKPKGTMSLINKCIIKYKDEIMKPIVQIYDIKINGSSGSDI